VKRCQMIVRRRQGPHAIGSPGWRHERHSAVQSLERAIGSRASLGVGSEDLICQGREHMKGSLRYKSLWIE
jgi:hypothetical protein